MDPYTQPKRALSGGFETTVVLGTGASGVQALVSAITVPVQSNGNAFKHYIHVQKVRVIVKTGSAGVTWTLQDGAGTPVVDVPAMDMSTAGTIYTYDFGPQGRRLTLGKDFNASLSGAGAAADVTVEGFHERTSTRVVTVTSVSASSGPAAGGTTVTVYGKSFYAGAAVTFGGTSATSVVVAADGQSLRCVTPAHTAGAVDVVVTNADATAGTGAGAFTYV